MNAETDVRGCTMVIAGFEQNENGEWKRIENPEPCIMCQRRLKEMGITVMSSAIEERLESIIGKVTETK